MKYMLLIYLGEGWNKLSPEQRQRVYWEQRELTDPLTETGQVLSGHPLHPPSAATSVRIRDGKPVLTDGPFAETREHLGGYILIEAQNLDEALALATRSPLARVGTIEVRPVREGPPT